MDKNHRKRVLFELKNSLRKLQVIVVFAVTALASTALAEAQTISGTVFGSDQEPLIGVSVSVKGTATGTVTGIDGKFSVNANESQVLVFSYIGYVSQEVTVSGSTPITVIMKEDKQMLDEVVVIGYGTQRKKLVTGATVQIKGDNIAKLNTINPLQAMQGQSPGVSIASTSGQPGSDMKVTIRGLGTVGNSGPLYLIDGIGGDITTLNPADIESIDVLKDAASAAIYGAQAANGVVLITTKQGKEGKAQVSFDAYYGVQNVARKAQMLNASQYMTIMDEQALNSGKGVFDWSSYDIYDANGNVFDTNWIDAMFKKNAATESYSLGITGGSTASTYAISLAYMNQEGIVGGSDVSNYGRYNFRVNSEHKLYKDLLKVGEQVSFIYVNKKGIDVDNQYNNTLRGAFGTSPITPIYSDNNLFDSPFNDTTNSLWNKSDGNPYGHMMTTVNNENKTATFNGNLYAEMQPAKNLKLRTVFGAVYASNEYRDFTPLYRFSQYDYNDVRTKVSQNMNHGLSMTWTNTATYDWKLNDHAFNALIGMESYRYQGTYLSGSNGALKEGFDTWEYAYLSNGTATSTTENLGVGGSPNDETRTVSYFARLGWNWKETYMINATIRADGSSKFARGNRFGYFPSISAGWILTNEAFMKNTESWLNYLKLRLSWGQVGNQNIDQYQYLAPMQITNTHYLFGSGYSDAAAASQLGTNWGGYPSRLANPDIKWETSEQTNVGFDARFLKRLDVNADFYIKTNKDWLVLAPILASVGAGAPYINGGSVKNTGVELALNWNDKIGNDFNYNIGVNGAYNKNKVGQIPTEDGIIHGPVNQLYDNTPEFYRAQNGYPIGYFWGFKTAGIFQNEQDIKDWIAAGNGVLQGGANVQPGDVKYVDVNHDGVIDDKDKVNLGNGMPNFTFGFNLGFEYKGLDFSVLASGATGQKIVQSYRNFTNVQANYTTAILGRWTGEGTSDRIPRVTEQNINWQFSDLFIQNGDYLRISNITLGYDFSKIISYKAFSQVRLYAQVQNAFTFTKYDGMDPEIGYGTADDNGKRWVSGVDVGYYPRPRTVLFGVSLKF